MDLCCFNRPFDDQSQNRVYLETEAKLLIQRKIKDRIINLVWSYILDYENSANPDRDAGNAIGLWQTLASQTVTASPLIIEKAVRFQKDGFSIKDSLHIACAIEARADHFLTVDKGMLKKTALVHEIKMMNPIEFVAMEE
jgi:predicted nucleic acid-binding protein